jgi:hypothetical protein
MNEFKIKKGLIVNGSGSTILDIQGSQGQLFSVTDQLSGSLFSVNDISGIPIMEVFSNNTVNLGTFNAEAIKVSGSFATMTGSLFGTASWANNATTASFASTASFVPGGLTGIGTSGQVSFFTGTTTQAGDNGLFWDNTNKRLGIGNTNPSVPLTITAPTGGDSTSLGSELLTSTNWTTTGWTGDFTNGFTHTPGNTNVLSHTFTPTITTLYIVEWTITNRTAGSVNISLGGIGTVITGTSRSGLRAETNANLTVTPSSDFDGTIVLSVKVANAYPATVSIRNSSNSEITQIRASVSGNNLFFGSNAGSRNYTTAIANTGIGSNTLAANSIGNYITAIGFSVFTNPSFSGNSYNVGVGGNIGTNQFFRGGLNTFIGWNIGIDTVTTTASNNIAIGYHSFRANGNNNTVIGNHINRPTGSFSQNVNIGDNSMFSHTTGNQNVSLGFQAGRYQSDGTTANDGSSNSIFIGTNSRALSSSQTNQIVIGHTAIGLGSNTTVIGNSSTATTALFGNVGIGTTSPTSRLEIVSSSAANYLEALRVTNAGDSVGTSTGIRLQVASAANVSAGAEIRAIRTNSPTGGGSDLVFYTSPSTNTFSERWKILGTGVLEATGAQTVRTSTGNLTLATGGGDGNILLTPNGAGRVGIGTTIPESNVPLTVNTNNNAFNSTVILQNSNTGGGSVSQIQMRTQSSLSTPLNITKFNSNQSATIINEATSSLGLGTSGSVRLHIASNGDVGIGTQSPTSRLHVVGNGKISNNLTLGENIITPGVSFGHADFIIPSSGSNQSGGTYIIHQSDVDGDGFGVASFYMNPEDVTELKQQDVQSPFRSSIIGLDKDQVYLLNSEGNGVGIGISSPSSYVHINSDPVDSKYLRIDAVQDKDFTATYIPDSGNTVNEVIGNVTNGNVLGQPDYWMEIELNSTGNIVLIPCYSPEVK